MHRIINNYLSTKNRISKAALIGAAVVILPAGAQFSAKISFGPPLEQVDLNANKYLQRTKEFSDFMISSGRNEKGVFAGEIDIETHAIGGNPDPDDDIDVYRTMYMLSLVGGNDVYADAADESFDTFLWNYQCKNSFYNWGEGGCAGEESAPMLLHDEMYEMAPFGVNRYARTYWFNCIGNKAKGYFNRHCTPTSIGGDYPKHGGFFLQIWAEALLRTGRRHFAEYFQTVFGFYDRERSPDRVIPYTSKSSDTHSKAVRMTIGYNVDAWKGMLLLEGEQKQAVLDGIILSDTVVLNLGQPDVQKVLWARPEGRASVMWNCYDRYVQLHNWGYHDVAEKYKAGILRNAQAIAETLPDPEKHYDCGDKYNTSSACIYGTAIYMLVISHRFDPDGGYLEAAQKWADQAFNTLFEGPLYGATHGCSYKVGQTYIGSLALGLFNLGMELASPETRFHFPNTVR